MGILNLVKKNSKSLQILSGILIKKKRVNKNNVSKEKSDLRSQIEGHNFSTTSEKITEKQLTLVQVFHCIFCYSKLYFKSEHTTFNKIQGKKGLNTKTAESY